MRDRYPHCNRNHSISLGKSICWFLYNRNISHKWVKSFLTNSVLYFNLLIHNVEKWLIILKKSCGVGKGVTYKEEDSQFKPQ